MKVIKSWVGLLTILFLFSGCAQLLEQEAQFPLPPGGAYSDYAHLRYYKTVFPRDTWREIEVIDYSEGKFGFPPPNGYRVLHYENPDDQSRIDLYREVIDGGTYLDIMERRQASDHCSITNSFYRQAHDLEIVVAQADCYLWLYGAFLRKYYFFKRGDVVYTFRLLSPPKKYVLIETDFDYFVKDAISNYIVYSPQQQPSPTQSIQYASSTEKKKGKAPFYFSPEEMLSFFAPVATKHLSSKN